MKIRLAYYTTLLLLLITASTSAQYIQVNDNYTAQQLVEDVLVNSPCASVSNFSVSGGNFESGAQSYGYFTAAGTSFPFENGIVLSTGRAVAAQGPNNSLLDDGAGMNWPGDQDLEQALNINNSINSTILEFDFVPLGNKISFNYMLSSEEYHDTAPCSYSDGFAFLLKEANSDAPYQNLAVVPNTDIPVKVTSVRPNIPGACGPENEEYFDAFNGNSHPTNFNGQTKVMQAQADVIPGIQYHIKLVIADEGNYRYDSAIFIGGGSFEVITDLGRDRLLARDNPVCDGRTLTLDATFPTAIGYQWYKNGTPITGENNPTFTVTSAGVYSVAVQITTDCFSNGEITIEYAANPEPVTRTLIQCDDNNDGLTTFNLQLGTPLVTDNNPDLIVNYYESYENAENGIDVIANTTSYQNTIPNQEIYARVQNRYACYTISTVILTTSANGVTNPAPIASCDEDGTDDGFFALDLTQRDAEILQGLPPNLELLYYLSVEDALEAINPIPDPTGFTNTVLGGQTVYARIYNGSECYGIAELELIIYTFGDSFAVEDIYLCDDNPLVLNPGSGYASYKWDTAPEQTTQTITVTEPGNYTVTVTNNFGCEGSKTYTVLQSGIAMNAEILIHDFTGNNNSITIIPEGLGDYEYSLDGLRYQDSDTFEELTAGEYTIYIRDKNGCNPVYTDTVFVLDYPKFFTPNGDGENETWRIPYMNSRPEITVTIFDRFGKIISGFNGNSNGWDGNLNGRKLPATDYWFLITLENGRIIRGHFALVR
ncbi:T9SS type B sorting domain-containing protein [Flavobacterium salilacus subsp. salilacus]|uniref:choice-of-anchor L domain-containing protein n=1 Tax=Flavobacterium TaxID=237 RepID=UPI001074D56C|nr:MULTISPECIES: choice-of-anchor L domain-containing protein [Flavobacterium]KAF2518456.1 T9SS type B sorting domain-containing protein [Flavobacterium salilacus subsp. salilacus]MBE1615095.1 choice-of-anchor L domain-containing protein [Flavobacterium sp. SaA2.13]